MTFLSPWTLALAVAIFLPPLIALYMLRLRRRPQRVPSTLLWQSAYEDLMANVPFQRLRWSLPLLLQAIALLLIAAAIARPVVQSADALGPRTVLLIDVGASMQVVDEPDGPTRLARALSAAEELVSTMPTGGEMMIVTFGASPRIRCAFDRSPVMLRSTLRAMKDETDQTDEPSDLAAALALAEGFTRPTEEEDATPATIVVLTDGIVADPRGDGRYEVAAAAARELRIGPAAVEDGRLGAGNLGIVALDGRRREDDPREVDLFVRLLWTGAEPLTTSLVIEVQSLAPTVAPDPTPNPAADARPVATPASTQAATPDEPVISRRVITMPAASGAQAEPPGELTVIERIAAADSALILVRHGHADPLEADDVAVLALPPPRALRLALVAPDGVPDAFARSLLAETEPESLTVMSEVQWRSVTHPADRFDLVVLDRVETETWPEIASISFGAAPPGVRRVLPADDGRPRGRRVIGWNRVHPLLRHAEIGDLIFSGVSALELPEGADAVALGPDGPIIAVVTHAGIRHVVVAFSLLESTLPVLAAFPVFAQNALDLLTGDSGAAGLVPRTGESLSLRVLPGIAEARIVDGELTRRLTVVPGTAIVGVPAASRIGLRRVISEPPGRFTVPGGLLPASLLSPTESDLRPRASLELIATALPPDGVAVKGQTEWWTVAIVIALALLALEWGVYLRRAGT